MSVSWTAVFFIIFAALEILSLLTIPSVVLRRRGNPISASAWLVALVTLPGITWLLWFIFGRTHLSRRTRRHAEARAEVSRKMKELEAGSSRLDDLIPQRARRNHSFSTSHNEVLLLPDGHNAYPQLEEALRGAKKSINMFFFSFEMDSTGHRILDLLIEKEKTGVVVRLLVDGLGTQKGEKKIRKKLSGTGVQMSVFLPKKLRKLRLPRLNFVNHRKIVVIDDEVGFTGGMNIGEDYEKRWRDLMLRVKGPTVFWLNNIFLEDWFFATGELLETPECKTDPKAEKSVDVTLVASGPSTEGWIEDAFFSSIVAAKKRIWLTTPYLIPTAPIQQALRSAAGRGVDVRILIPNKCDVLIVHWAARPYFRSLLNNGIRLFEYDGMVHGKALIADDYCAVGSANLDYRSMHLSFEICCFMDDAELTEQLCDWYSDLLAKSHEAHTADLDKMTRTELFTEGIAHLFSPLL